MRTAHNGFNYAMIIVLGLAVVCLWLLWPVVVR